MKSLAVVSCVAVVSLWMSLPARAGTFNSPFSDASVCGNRALVGHMGDPTDFQDADRCDSLCKKAAAACAKLVRRIAACQVAYTATDTAIELEACKQSATPELAAACKLDVKQNLAVIKAGVLDDREFQVVQCKHWGDDCRLYCPN